MKNENEMKIKKKWKRVFQDLKWMKKIRCNSWGVQYSSLEIRQFYVQF